MQKIALILILLGAAACSNGDADHTYTGVIEGTDVHVPALVGGQIVEMAADVGAQVEPGQFLVQLDSTELHLQFLQTKAMKAELAAQLGAAQSNLERAQNDVAYASEMESRLAGLVEKNSAPRQKLDDVKNMVSKAEAGAKVAHQQMMTLNAKQAQLEAQLTLLRKKISDTRIKSPIDGVISSTFFEKGEAVAPFAPVLEIIHLKKVEVKIYISAALLPQVKLNDQVKIQVDGLNESLSGRIKWISPKAEFSPKSILTPETRTSLVYAVKIEIDNPEGILKHGMPVEVIL